MASGNEPAKDVAALKERLRALIASLGSEELEEVLRDVGRGKELDVARAMIERVNKK